MIVRISGSPAPRKINGRTRGAISYSSALLGDVHVNAHMRTQVCRTVHHRAACSTNRCSRRPATRAAECAWGYMWDVQATESDRSRKARSRARSSLWMGRKSRWYLPASLITDLVGAGVPVTVMFSTAHQPWPVPSGIVAGLAWAGVQLFRSRYAARSIGESRGTLPVLHDWFILLGVLAVVHASAGIRLRAPLCLLALLAGAAADPAVPQGGSPPSRRRAQKRPGRDQGPGGG